MEKIKKGIAKLREGLLRKALAEFRWLWRLLKDYRRRIVLHALIMIVTAVVPMLVSLQSKGIVDVVVGADWQALPRFALVILPFSVLNIWLSAKRDRMAGRIGAEIKMDLADRTYQRIMNADWETVVQHHSGDLLTRIQEDVTAVSGSAVGWMPAMLYQAVQIIAALAIIVYFDPLMLLMMLLLLPLFVLGSRPFLGKQYLANQQERTVSAKVMTRYKESFQHLQSIKGFGLVPLFSRKMREQLAERRDVEIELNRYNVLSWLVMYCSGEGAALICLAVAVYHVYKGMISIGSLTLLMMMAGRLSNAFKELLQRISPALATVSASERIRGILELPEEKIENEAEYQRLLALAQEKGVSVRMEHMDFAYADGTEVLRDVTCRVEAGEIAAFVGPSGEGKTTMLRILLGLVKTENEPVLEAGGMKLPVSPAARRLMAYVPQGNTILSGTIAENLRMFDPAASEEEIIGALKAACAWEFVEKLPNGIHHNIGESGIGFSEGQNQRLAIARALMCKTPILLLDEATSALDVATERRVLHNLMGGEHKRTCILTTHRPSVLSMCDRVYRIASKTVRQIGEEEVRQVMNEF